MLLSRDIRQTDRGCLDPGEDILQETGTFHDPQNLLSVIHVCLLTGPVVKGLDHEDSPDDGKALAFQGKCAQCLAVSEEVMALILIQVEVGEVRSRGGRILSPPENFPQFASKQTSKVLLGSAERKFC